MNASEAQDPTPGDRLDAQTTDILRAFFDREWYLEKYPDVRAGNLDPLAHFALHGAAEGRDPNRFFDTAWYLARNPDVAATAYPALLHYLKWGARELRNPHPHFDATYYAEMHPEAADNPLLYHITIGASRGWPTEKVVQINDYLPSDASPISCPEGIVVDVIVAVYRGLQETVHCLESVLDDPDRPPGGVIVVEDCSPDRQLVLWLEKLAMTGRITLLQNDRNLGFVASVNIGMKAAGSHDVALLNSDTVVPSGWLRRLAAQAYASPHVASVSPFSNNATICGYPSVSGVSPAFGLDPHAIDAACRSVNTGRAIDVPTTVGFCMYIRRAALNSVGLFDHKTFGQGYGEENDFCLRASACGWRHLLACDTYVFHEGNVSFGAAAVRQKQRGLKALIARYPDYESAIARHVQHDAAGPARFAVTAALLRASEKPCVLLISHQLGGGVRRHIDELTAQLGKTVNVLLLSPSAFGIALSVPSLTGHSVFTLPSDRLHDLARYLRSTNLRRVHMHHVIGLDLDLLKLMSLLEVEFDVTVHDYFAICPQVNLLPSPNHQYCGEPGPATCNACIATRPSHGAREILAWRRAQVRLLVEAERVLCPSDDARARLSRHGLARNAILAPHEPVTESAWIVRPRAVAADRPLQVAVIGVMAGHKGELSLAMLAEAASPKEISLHIIGYAEHQLPPTAAARINVTGEYRESELPGLLATIQPHVVWFPARWPETYSYTLSAAIHAELPIVATRIGAFPERLEGRPLTWLVDPAATTEEWLAVFRDVRVALGRKAPRSAVRRTVADFYGGEYNAPLRAPTVRRREIDLRQPGRLSVVVIPERSQSGALSPCAYIRLLQPLDHPAIAEKIGMVMAEAGEVSRFRTDIIATQRYAIPNIAVADALAARCRETGARLLYDLDDDLLHIPRDHPEAETLRPRAQTVSRMLYNSDEVWVSTPSLATALRKLRRPVRVVPNGLDERLWVTPRAPRSRPGAVRVLFMGSATHHGDWAVVATAMGRVAAAFGPGVTFDMIGFVGPVELPNWINRVSPSTNGAASYPGFVNWITDLPSWDIGIAPLADTAFNHRKSTIKTLDYAALGLAVLGSDVPAYRGSLADGVGGRLVDNTEAAWFRALHELIENAALRQRLADGARTAFTTNYTLAKQAHLRRAAWVGLSSATAVRPRQRPAAVDRD